MLKKILTILTLSILTLSYSYAIEAIEFVKTKEWKVIKVGKEGIELSCTAVFYNPNNVKAKLKDIDIDVFFNDLKAGNISQPDGKVKVGKQSAFDVPLSIKFSPDKNQKGYFSGFLTAVTLKDFVIKLQGYLKLQALGIPLKVKINDSETVNLKQLIKSE
ncbi:MAG: hypothetical protein KDE33_21970 [Bacteroidetes bacterium]|nr:hypothetical protein [Bacteroidota bacterium]MCB9226443.1 hypothetical protein [Chitinophagales bacterium]